jgi:hypothetical protein
MGLSDMGLSDMGLSDMGLSDGELLRSASLRMSHTRMTNGLCQKPTDQQIGKGCEVYHIPDCAFPECLLIRGRIA